MSFYLSGSLPGWYEVLLILYAAVAAFQPAYMCTHTCTHNAVPKPENHAHKHQRLETSQTLKAALHFRPSWCHWETKSLVTSVQTGNEFKCKQNNLLVFIVIPVFLIVFRLLCSCLIFIVFSLVSLFFLYLLGWVPDSCWISLLFQLVPVSL